MPAELLCIQVDVGVLAIVPNESCLAMGKGCARSAWTFLGAGAFAGIASTTATAPFDRLKVLQQVRADGEAFW
jgi:hypothetical protein